MDPYCCMLILKTHVKLGREWTFSLNTQILTRSLYFIFSKRRKHRMLNLFSGVYLGITFNGYEVTIPMSLSPKSETLKCLQGPVNLPWF